MIMNDITDSDAGAKYNLYIGDIHGEIYLLENVIEEFEANNCNKCIFIGDYVDSYDCTDVEIIHCFKMLIEFKQKYPDRVICLLGNHDWQYYNLFSHESKWSRCSGFRNNISVELYTMFTDYSNLFEIAHKQHKYLATHAGVSKKWYGNYYDRLLYYLQGGEDIVNDFDKVLNRLKDSADRWILSTIGKIRNGYGYGGPIWADKSEMGTYDSCKQWDQIVGHNRVNDITKVDNVTFIDCLRNKINFLKLKIEE